MSRRGETKRVLENDEIHMTKGLFVFFRVLSFEFPSSFDIRASSLISSVNLSRPECRNFSDKICCDLLEARLVASKFFKIVLGGTAALHAYRVWGAVIF